MKKRHLMFVAGLLIGGVWLGQASASPVGGTWSRSSNSAPEKATACMYSWVGNQAVNMESRLNALGANINIRPSSSCNRRERNHVSQLVTSCFGGGDPQFTTRNGTPSSDADIFHSCFFNGGGQASMWYMNAL